MTPTAGSELSNILGALVAAGVHMVDASTPSEYAANVKQSAGDLVDMLVAVMSERDTQEPPRYRGGMLPPTTPLLLCWLGCRFHNLYDNV